MQTHPNSSKMPGQSQMASMLESLRRFSVDTIKDEPSSDCEADTLGNDYFDKFTSEVFVGYNSDSSGSDCGLSGSDLKSLVCTEDLEETLVVANEGRIKKKKKKKSPKEKSTSITDTTVDDTKTHNLPLQDACPANETPNNCLNKMFECHLCRKQFAHMSFLKKHILKHDSKFRVSCLLCHKTISDPDKLETHMQVHYKDNLHICQSCGKAFRRSANLNRHELLCGKEKVSANQLCTLCGKLCHSKWQLHQHMMYHSDERPFPCAYCTKTFRFKSRLQEHERTHLGIKPHSCDVCKKGFTTSSDLKKHQKRHLRPGFKGYNTGNNPNKLSLCKICNKRVVNLKSHMYLHYEKGSGNCGICGKILKSKSLYQHIKIHLEGALFECDVCHRTFNRKDNMLSHRERHRKVGYRPKVPLLDTNGLEINIGQL